MFHSLPPSTLSWTSINIIPSNHTVSCPMLLLDLVLFNRVYPFTAICQTWVLSKHTDSSKKPSWSLHLNVKVTLFIQWGQLVDRWTLCSTPLPSDSPQHDGGPPPPLFFWNKVGFLQDPVLFFSFSPNCHLSFYKFQCPTSLSDLWILCHILVSSNNSQ